jgi:N,N'-diacetyl-8-epilegionaminate cytidylyltransferase
LSRPYTIGLICARGGSKGVSRKNLRSLGGKPLLGWAVEVARECPSIERVIVSTEDEEIAAVAKSFGAEVPFIRPCELARDDSAELLVWQHAIRTLASLDNKTPEVLVNIPPTSPLRAVEDVEGCIENLSQNDADLCITVRQAQRNPYFNMIKLENGWASLVIPSSGGTFRRQDAPEVFDMTTVAYAARCDYVIRTRGLLDGKVRAALVPDDRAVDIDTEFDLAFAEFLLQRRHKSD